MDALPAYAMELAKLKPSQVRFVIIDGSTAENSDQRYSDYDLVVVRKGLAKQPGSVEDLFGVFNGRIVSGWLVDEESFRHRYLGDDDPEFLWRRRQLRKARLLFGDQRQFETIMRRALRRKWNKWRQMAALRYSYVTMVEYMGKMLNKRLVHEDNTPEFYQDGYIVAKNSALLVAALNKMNLDSDKNMYRGVMTHAKLKPPNFQKDFEMASGLSAVGRNKEAVVAASKRLVRWARSELVEFAGEAEDTGFSQLLREVRF